MPKTRPMRLSVLLVVVFVLASVGQNPVIAERTFVYSHADPARDEGWLYPTDSVFVPGLFDILHFNVSYDDAHAYFDITFGKVTNSYFAPLGFSHQLCQVFVDSDRRFGSGSTDSLSSIYYSTAVLTDEAPFEFTIFLRGWGTYINMAKNATYIDPTKIELNPFVIGDTISIPVPLNIIGTPTGKWAYVVWCGSENFGGFRDVMRNPAQYFLGGGSDRYLETHITDFLAEPGFNKRDTFDAYLKNALSYVYPVGVDLYIMHSLYTLTDFSNDTRSLGPLYQNASACFDILSIEVLNDMRHIVFRVNMGDMQESASKTNGFDNLLLQIYVDTDNILKSGSNESQFNGQFSFWDNKGWEFMVSIDPDKMTAVKYAAESYETIDLTQFNYIRANNRIVEVKIPKSFLAGLPSVDDYMSWYVMGSSGIALSSQYLNLCQKTCLSSEIKSLSSNVVDILTPKNINNKQIFDQSVTREQRIMLPFLSATGLTMSEMFFTRDVAGDELAFYPIGLSGGVLNTNAGLFDILSFGSYSDTSNVRFNIELQGIQSSFTGKHPVIQINIDQDRIYWSGSTLSRFNSGVSFHPQNAYEVTILLDPQTASCTFITQSSKLVISNSTEYQANFVTAFIPQAIFGSILNSVSWAYSVFSGIRSDSGTFMDLSDDSGGISFDRRSPGLTYNVMDVLASESVQRETIAYWQQNPLFMQIPYIGPGLTYLWADALYDDANGDEFGIYPLNPYFTGKKGLFDILSFSVQHSANFTRYAMKIQTLSDAIDPILPVGFLATQIYIDTDRVHGRGCQTPVGNANIMPHPQYAWEYAIFSYGKNTYVYVCDDNGFVKLNNTVPILRQRSMLYFDIPVRNMPYPTKTWNFVVVTGAVFDQNLGTLIQFTEQPTSTSFGGGDTTNYGVNIADALLPPSILQAKLFKSYNVPKKTYAVIAPVGSDVVVGGVIWEKYDVAHDERGQYPKSIGQYAGSGLFDILYFSAATTIDSAIFRVAMATLMTTSNASPLRPKYTLLHIYINTDGDAQTGSTASLYNANVRTGEPAGWEFAVVLGPSGALLYSFNSTNKMTTIATLDKGVMICEGNSVVVQISTDLLGVPQSSWSYVVFSGMESSTPWNFVTYSDQPSQTTFGGDVKSAFTPNVVDILTRYPSDQTAILSSYNTSPGVRASVPFIGGSDVLTLFSTQDAPYDEFGLYTTNPDMGGINPSGLLDITQFDVQFNWTHLILSTKIQKPITNPRNYTYGFTFPIISVYCHENVMMPGRYPTADKSFIDLNYPWTWMALMHGEGRVFHYGLSWPGSMKGIEADAQDNLELYFDRASNQIKIFIPTDFGGNPNPMLQYTVLIGLYDPTSGDYSLRNKEPSTRFLGGGDDDFYDPNVADVIIPSVPTQTSLRTDTKVVSDTLVQNFILSNYDVAKQQRTVVPSVGLFAKFLLGEWYQPSPESNNQAAKSGRWNELRTILISVIVPVVVLSAIFLFVYIRQNKNRLADLGWNVNFNELSFIQKIGSGSFGEVYRGEWRDSTVAIKTLFDKNLSRSSIQDFQREIAIMCELRHPCLCMFMGGCINPPNLFIITEFMDRGSLYDLLQDENLTLSTSHRYMFAHDSAKGMSFLHSHDPPIIHGDMKSVNILVDSKWQVKISDFGLSRFKGTKSNAPNTTFSLMWAPPEVLSGQPATEKSDVFSFGIVLWEIFSHEELYSNVDPSSIPLRVLRGHRPPINDYIAQVEGIEGILKLAWDANPDARPTMSAIRKQLSTHPILASSSPYPPSVMASTTPTSEFNQTASSRHSIKTFVFMDIFMGNLIWEQNPEEMYHALNLYISLIRNSIPQFQGLEIRMDSDTCFLLFPSAQSGLEWALKFQEALLDLEWPPRLVQTNKYCGNQVSKTGAVIFNGPRVRTAIHCGEAGIQENPMNGQRTFIGPAVSKTRYLCSILDGGQVALTEEAYVSAQFDHNPGFKHHIKELSYANNVESQSDTKVFQILSDRLAERQYRELRLRQSASTALLPGAQTPDRPEDTEEKPTFHINYDEVKQTRVLGTGSFGQVLLATYKGREVAVKKLLRQKMTQKGIADFRREVLVMKNLDHPNVVKLIGICVEMPNLCIVLEHMTHGSVEDLLKNKDFAWTNPLRLKMLQDAARGIKYIHECKPPIIHRDLKSANLLVGEEYLVKICDFGVSRIQTTQNTMTKCGTPAWAAPEILRGERYNVSADVYSFGIIMWEMISRRLPYTELRLSPAAITGEIATGRLRPPITSDFAKKYEELMKRCWDQNPDVRPAMETVLIELSDPITLS